jgi:TonB family protein
MVSIPIMTFPIAPAELVRREEPEYPAIADKMALHGTVKLKIWISPDGSVRRLEYVGGHPLLAESALKAVKAWKYETNSKETTAMVEVRLGQRSCGDSRPRLSLERGSTSAAEFEAFALKDRFRPTLVNRQKLHDRA